MVLVLGVCLFSAKDAVAAEIALRETACRLYDSRNIGGLGLGSKISTATIETMGDAGGSQGGEIGCGVPSTATGVILNLTVYQPTSSGYARLWPYGATEPLPPSITFASGQQDEASGLMVSLGTAGKLSANLPFGASHFIVDLAGWTIPCAAEVTYELTYSQSSGAISVPVGDVDLMKYWHGAGSKIRLGGDASQPGTYTITGASIGPGLNGDRQRLFVTPTPQSATDQALGVILLDGDCAPRI